MNELQQCMQMEVMGGGVTGFFFCVVIGTAIYKMFRSGAGRVSIPKIISQSSGVKMKELSITSQQKINGGGAIVYVISLVAVAAGYSVAKLLRKRFSITR